MTVDLNETAARLVHRRDYVERSNDMWPAYVVRAADLAEAMAELEEGKPGDDGRREFSVVHPNSVEPGLGLAPGIETVFGLLLPGESTRNQRHNASSFAMCLTGSGQAEIDDVRFDLGHRDTWVTPSMSPHTLRNTGTEPFTYVQYSNKPWLQKLEIYYLEYEPPTPAEQMRAFEKAARTGARIKRAKDLAPAFAIGDGTSMLLPYEHLINPEFVESKPLKWAWQDVAPHLGFLKTLGVDYTGRPLFCLYNPATGNRNGTTFNFFATISNGIGNRVGPAHRHSSSAINYILDGSGWSVIDGVRIEWEAGDIMLSAPGWAIHGHARGPDGAAILTVQDHPLQIGAESLIWQEDLKSGPILSLGKQAGFETNLAKFLADD